MSRPSAFRESVNLRGKPCCWTRHFQEGCARTVIGYLQKLAANDPERFCWPSFGDIARHAKNWAADQSGGLVYAERQVRRALRLLEALGIVLPMLRKRSGRERLGWIVVQHATPPEKKCCTVPSIGLTYRSTKKVNEISTANVSFGKGFVSAFVSGEEGFVSGKSAECVRECVRSEETEAIETHKVDGGSDPALSQVSQGLIFNEPRKPVLSAFEKQIRKDESVTSGDLPLSSVQSFKAEKPERAKTFFEVRPGIRLTPFGQVARHCADKGGADLSEITRMSLEWCKKNAFEFVVPQDPAGEVTRIFRRREPERDGPSTLAIGLSKE